MSRSWIVKLTLGAALYALGIYVIVTKPPLPSCPTPTHVEAPR